MVIVADVVPADQVVDIGRQARLECLTEERDRASITWRKDGQLILPSPNLLITRHTLQGSVNPPPPPTEYSRHILLADHKLFHPCSYKYLNLCPLHYYPECFLVVLFLNKTMKYRTVKTRLGSLATTRSTEPAADLQY